MQTDKISLRIQPPPALALRRGREQPEFIVVLQGADADAHFLRRLADSHIL